MKNLWLVFLVCSALNFSVNAAPKIELDPSTQQIEVSTRTSIYKTLYGYTNSLYLTITVDGVKVYDNHVASIADADISEAAKVLAGQYKVIADQKIRAAKHHKSAIILDTSLNYAHDSLIKEVEQLPNSDIISVLGRLDALEADVRKLQATAR